MAKDYSEYKKKYEALQKKTAGTGRGGLKPRATPKAATDAREALIAKFKDPAQRKNLTNADFNAVTSALRKGTVSSNSAKPKDKKVVNKPVAKKPATTTKKPKLSAEKREKRAERRASMTPQQKQALAKKRAKRKTNSKMK
jgi:hypothetical protein